MSEVKKIATRESYGKALVELGAEHSNLVVLDADLAEHDRRRRGSVYDGTCAVCVVLCDVRGGARV